MQSLGRTEVTVGQHHFQRQARPDRPWQALRAAGARDDAQRNFRLSEARRLRCNDEIAHHREFAAPAQRPSRNSGDDRFAQHAEKRANW